MSVILNGIEYKVTKKKACSSNLQWLEGKRSRIFLDAQAYRERDQGYFRDKWILPNF